MDNIESIPIEKKIKKKTKLRLGVSDDAKSKEKDSQTTPKDLYDSLHKEFNFDFDPCPLNGEQRGLDGLKSEWGQCNFVNPPYSDAPTWLIKGYLELAKGKKSVFLIPVRCNTKYWENYVYPIASEIRYFLQPVKFEGYDRGLPIGLVVIIMDPARKPITEICKIGDYTAVVWKRDSK